MSTKKGKQNHGSVVLTSSPYESVVKEKAEKKQELRNFGRQMRKRLELDLDDMFQEELFDKEENCPCLNCNELFSFSKLGETWLQCTECKLWAHCTYAGVVSRRAK
jgi:hypothetical protein